MTNLASKPYPPQFEGLPDFKAMSPVERAVFTAIMAMLPRARLLFAEFPACELAVMYVRLRRARLSPERPDGDAVPWSVPEIDQVVTVLEGRLPLPPDARSQLDAMLAEAS